VTKSKNDQFGIPDTKEFGPEVGPRTYKPNAIGTDNIDAVIRRHEATLLAIPGVVLITRGMPTPGVESIVVGVINASVLDFLPKDIGGIPIYGEVTGPIEAL
jgi:hypothetical protein